MKKKTSLLFLIRIVKLLVGILNLSLTAKYFGVGLEKDLWLLALSVVLFLDLAIWGPINETFRSKFIFLRSESGENVALDKTKSLIFFSVIISIGLVILILIFPQILAKIIAPTYSGIQYEKLIKMIVIAAPILLITQLSSIATSLLNAYESFFIPEITGFASSIINSILLIFLAPYIGIYSLVLSYYFGAILLLLLLYFHIKKLKIPILSFTKIRFNDFKIFFLFALPFFLPYSFGQLSAILEKILVSGIGIGNVSALDYSRKFTDIFINVLTSVLVTMLVPVLTSKFVEKKYEEFIVNFKEIFQLGIILLAFVIPIFTSSAMSIIKFFFDKGKISNEKLLEISQLTIFYSWSMLSVFVYLIFGMALLASNRSKKYAYWGVAAQIISILINLAFVKSMGIYVFPVSLILSHMICGIAMAYNFPFKNKDLFTIIFKYISILVLTIFLVFFISKFEIFIINFSPLCIIIFNSIITLTIVILFIFLFNLNEKKAILSYYIKLKKICLDF